MNISPFSVVVCTHNRLPYLQKCLESLLALNYPNFEIIIVNDKSKDGTKDYLDNLNDNKVKVIHNEKNLGLSLARNRGIEAAQHDIIAFTDDDCIVDKDWLKNLVQAFQPTSNTSPWGATSDRIGLVIGQTFYIEPGYKGYFPERLVNNPEAKWPMGCNIAYRKKVFENSGDFDDKFFHYNNEDSEMAIRAVANGFDYARASEARVYHQAINWTVPALLRSARNASVWPILKKQYPQHYAEFGPPVWRGKFVNVEDYLYLLLLPILIPALLLRCLYHGKRDLKIFFTKWPLWLFLRRYYVYKEAIRNKILML